jgi:hypothetical protein
VRDYREPWLDREGAARYFACSTSSIDKARQAGMPHKIVFGKPKFLASECEPWLYETGRVTVPATNQNGGGDSPLEESRPPTTEE